MAIIALLWSEIMNRLQKTKGERKEREGEREEERERERGRSATRKKIGTLIY